MNKNIKKLIAYLLSCSMFLSGCKLELESILNKDDKEDQEMILLHQHPLIKLNQA